MKPIVKTLLSWLITGVIGAIITYLVITSNNDLSSDRGAAMLIIFVIGTVCSAPGFIIYHFISGLIDGQALETPMKNIYRSLLAFGIVLATCAMLFSALHMGDVGDRENGINIYLLVLLSYGSPFAVCAWLFNPNGRSDEEARIRRLQATLDDEHINNELAGSQEAADSTEPPVSAFPGKLSGYLNLLTAWIAISQVYAIFSSRYSYMRAGFPGLLVLHLLLLAASVAGIVLLWKRNKWGWVLITVQLLQSLLGLVYLPYLFFIGLSGHAMIRGAASNLVMNLFNVVLLVLMLRPFFYQPFGITPKFRLNAILLGILVNISIWGLTIFVAGYRF